MRRVLPLIRIAARSLCRSSNTKLSIAVAVTLTVSVPPVAAASATTGRRSSPSPQCESDGRQERPSPRVRDGVTAELRPSDREECEKRLDDVQEARSGEQAGLWQISRAAQHRTLYRFENGVKYQTYARVHRRGLVTEGGRCADGGFSRAHGYTKWPRARRARKALVRLESGRRAREALPVAGQSSGVMRAGPSPHSAERSGTARPTVADAAASPVWGCEGSR